MNNYIHRFLWDVITHPSLQSNGGTAFEVWPWISYYKNTFHDDAITYPDQYRCCGFQVGYSNYDNTDKEMVDLNAIGGFANLVNNSNYGKQPKYIFYLGKASKMI